MTRALAATGLLLACLVVLSAPADRLEGPAAGLSGTPRPLHDDNVPLCGSDNVPLCGSDNVPLCGSDNVPLCGGDDPPLRADGGLPLRVDPAPARPPLVVAARVAAPLPPAGLRFPLKLVEPPRARISARALARLGLRAVAPPVEVAVRSIPQAAATFAGGLAATVGTVGPTVEAASRLAAGPPAEDESVSPAKVGEPSARISSDHPLRPTRGGSHTALAEGDSPGQANSLPPRPELRVAARPEKDVSVPDAGPSEEPQLATGGRPPSPERAEPSQVATSVPQPRYWSAELAARRRRIESTLARYGSRIPNTQEHSPWQVMHTILAWGVDARIEEGGPSGRSLTAVGWLCYNRKAKGYNLFLPSEGGFRTRVGPGMQGHEGQFLAMLAQARVRADYPLEVGDARYTVADLVHHEQATCRAGAELTFKLIGITYYLGSEATWTSDDGKEWSTERLLAEELRQPIRGAACGGTHRLMGYAHAVRRRVRDGHKLEGTWLEGLKVIREHHRRALALQNRDGSLSTEWFRGPGRRWDLDRRLQTSGHILEWLTYSLARRDLLDQRVGRAVDYVASLLSRNTKRDWNVGQECHALRALAVYDERLFGDGDEALGANEPPLTARADD